MKNKLLLIVLLWCPIAIYLIYELNQKWPTVITFFLILVVVFLNSKINNQNKTL